MSSDQRGLHDVLEGLYVAHKCDIDLYCSGHLNHNRLRKPKEVATHKPWQSYSEDVTLLRQPSKLPSPRRSAEKEKYMTQALYDFSIGTSGSLPLPGIIGSQKEGLQTASCDSDNKGHTTNREKNTGSRLRPNSVASYISDGAYIEELDVPDLMLPVSGIKTHRKSQLTDLSLVQNERREKYEKRQFLSTHLSAITKKDQFAKMREFDNTVLRKAETREQSVLSGKQAVQHLERKLQQRLEELGHMMSSPNFHRLQVYSDIWDDMLQDTPTFSKILKAIKGEYDIYMGSLLDTQPQQQSQVLYKQVRGLAASGTSIPGQVKHEQNTVQQIEMQAKQLLQDNQRLRNSVEDEKADFSMEPLPDVKAVEQSDLNTRRDSGLESFEQQITALHIGILELVEDMKEERQQIQQNYVPSAVCKHLEHGVKEMEIAVLKVLSTNEYLEKTIQQLEIDIEKVMEKASIEDAESRQVWKAINTLSVPMEEGDPPTPR
ncbi:uncharacterized protein C6orf118-like [Anneissia japonica]|uniref:uncharacterized protein C6orf118-like n=1 Tax=Anneissia japonica TaxID=1529436 RepID=UPI00142595FB|nr:uncharacterized protein C6orf118-like [Anneissia japonica]